MKKLSFWMVLGCILPLRSKFLLPLFGVTNNYTLLILIVLLFGFHLMLMGKHGHQYHSNPSQNNKEKNESHQH